MELIRSNCRSCFCETNHHVLEKRTKHSTDDDYAFDITYQMIECLGCNTISFRIVEEEIEHAYQVSEEEWEVPTNVYCYPQFLNDHRILDGVNYLPTVVYRIYRETISSITEEATILPSLGLRAIVEAVCNDLEITGNNLEERIDNLNQQGYISERDASLLHGIRFMGNDAAHNLKIAQTRQLSIALNLVEHLLSTVYILPEKAEGNIESVITDFPTFNALLEDTVKHLPIGEEFLIQKILENKFRLIKKNYSSFEDTLISNIDANVINYLIRGKTEPTPKGKLNRQYFIKK